jgi:glycosyltransferase involved in cell wall biosynthesis
VVLVDNPLRAYSRANRFARSLAAAGWDTTLVGTADAGLPAEERLAPADWPIGGDDATAPTVAAPGQVRDVRLLRLPASGTLAGFLHGAKRRGLIHRVPVVGGLARALGWPLAARAWGRTLRDLPPADLYHACGIGAGVVARDLAVRAKRRGRHGRVVYDYIDVVQESELSMRYPRWRRALFPRVERRVVAAADALTSVNDDLAADARRRWRLAQVPLVVYNAPPRNEIPGVDVPDLVRTATGIPPERGIVLFIGRFTPDRPVLEAGDAVLELEDAAFVALGYGAQEAALRARDREPHRAGRHFTLPAVPPEAVTRWTARADATLVMAPADVLNTRLMTPNKLWESLAAGVPVVVGERQLAAQRIVESADLGVRARAGDVASLVSALRRLLDAPHAERDARRERAKRLVGERYAWDVTVPAYLRLVRTLVIGDMATSERSRSTAAD